MRIKELQAGIAVMRVEVKCTEEFLYHYSPIVALYWLENRLLTYWFIREVLPTLYDR